MTKRQKVSFIVTTGDDEVLDNLAVELNCQGFGELEHIEIDDNPMIPLTQEEVTKFNKFAEEKELGTGSEFNEDKVIKDGKGD